MTKLIWAGLGLPLAMLLVLTGLRMVQHEVGFGPVALTAAGLYIVTVAPIGAWLNAKGWSVPRAPSSVFWFLAFFGLSMAVRGIGMVRGTAALLVMTAGTVSLGSAAWVSRRSRRRLLRGDLVTAAGAEMATGQQHRATLDAEPGGPE